MAFKTHLSMLRVLVLFSALSLFFLLEAEGRIRSSSLARGLRKVQYNLLKRADPIRMLKTGSTVTSLYVGSTGIWMRSGVIASISQMEQGKTEEAMETLNIAMTTLTVFDITQATVSPIASELIYQLVKHKGHFPQTIKGMTQYNKALAERTLSGTADDVDDIIDGAHSLKKRIGNFFDDEVTTFMKNTQGYDDLVKSLGNTKKWAKALTWADTLSGPLFDALGVAFSSWELHNAIHDEHSPPEVRSLNIASSSLGVVSGSVGLASFAVGVLATAGSTLAAVAGPVGAIIGCVLSIAALIIDLINKANPYGTIKDHLETIQKLKEGSLEYLENEGNITQPLISNFKQNTGFDIIYQLNQGNMITGMRGDSNRPISGVDKFPDLKFDAKISPGRENGYLTMGKHRIFDKSKYANIIFKPSGKVPLGYDFYGNVTKPNGKGVAVFATTTMVAEHFLIRGVHIDTRVKNDDKERNPDNVVIGEMTGLESSSHNIRVWTGAGDDLLHITGLICFEWTNIGDCIAAELGSGINTLSFQGMNYEKVDYPIRDGGKFKVFAGIKFDMRDVAIHPGSQLYYRLKESNSSHKVMEYHLGFVSEVNVFHGSPFDDEIVMGDDKNCFVKSDNGTNNYIIYLHGEHDFTHTITDNSKTLGSIFLVWKKRTPATYTEYELRDVAYDEETQTLVVFVRTNNGEDFKKHTFTGRIIIKRTKPGDVKEMKLYLVKLREDDSQRCPQVPSLDKDNAVCSGPYTLGQSSIKREIGSNLRYNRDHKLKIKDRPVPSVPFHYYLDTNLKADPIPGLCGDFIISLGRYYGDHKKNHQFSMKLPTNSFLVVDDDLTTLNLESYSSHIELYYLKSDKKLVYQTRLHTPPGEELQKSLIEVHVPEAKRIVVGTPGSFQLLLDLKHDDRPAVNLNCEYLALLSRPIDEYKFDKDYTDHSTKPKQVVLGVPAKTPTKEGWKITLGKSQTSNAVKYQAPVPGNYAENALIVGDTLWAHLSREENDVSIEFAPIEEEANKWKITVTKGDQRLHQVSVDGANTLAYHEKLVRSNLYNLVDGEKETFDLYDVWSEKMAALESDLNSEATLCL